MRIIPLFILLFFSQCFIIYTKNETILESTNIDTKYNREEKDVFVLSHTLTSDGLYFLLDGYRVEEDNQINFIREKYKENKGIKFKNIFEKGVGGCDLYFCGAILVIATTVMILETTTLPFRIMSEPKERIEKEIKTLQSNKIGILPVENIYLVLIDSRSQDRILFEDNKAFVSFEDLKLNSFNRKNYSYKLFNGDNDKSILTGNLDFTEQIEANKELQASILANDTSFKSLKCQKEFPILLNQNLSKKDASLKLQEICINKHAKSTTFVWNNPEYKACLYSIKDCYKETDN